MRLIFMILSLLNEHFCTALATHFQLIYVTVFTSTTDLFNCLSKHTSDPCKQIFRSRSERGCANRDRSIAAKPDIDHG